MQTRWRYVLALAFLIGAVRAEEPKRARRAPLSLAQRIQALLGTDAARSARWGIRAVALPAGRVLISVNADDRFLPASNTKLFSTALALERLGLDYRFETKIVASAGPDADGVLRGDLRLVGGGDPTLSGRAYPYRKDAEPGDPLEPIEDLAEQVAARGVRAISGGVVGDDTRYVWAPYPEGWTVDDSIWEYGAPVSALTFNDNAFALTLRPGEIGELARASINPPVLTLFVDNRVATRAEGETRISIERLPGSRQLRVHGTLSQKRGNVRQLLAVDDPALYAATALHDALTRRGIRIGRDPAALHRWSAKDAVAPLPAVELARRQSPPLIEIARVVNKVSQNLHAEILLRETARVRRQEATREAGLKELEAFLAEIGVPATAYHFEDGSGLSRRTLVSPSVLARLLTYMSERPYHEAWESLLPIGGEDGTLSYRFDRQAAAAAIHAKTGTLANASALSGYLVSRAGTRIAFSILANNHTIPSSEIRKVIDKIGLALIEDGR